MNKVLQSEYEDNDSPAADAPAAKEPGHGLWAKYKAVKGGLPEYWYPVCTTAQLKKRKRMTLEVLGKKLVLFHEQGRCYALIDECSHRKVPLSLGRFEFPGHITCGYHGWTFDLKTGNMVAALTDGPDSAVNNRVSVRTFPVEERFGLLFIWMGQGKPVPVEDDIPTELLSDDARVYSLVRTVDGNWRNACENGFDESHLKMLHRYSIWTTFRNIAAWNETSIEKSKDGIWLQRVQKAVHLSIDQPGLGTWPKKRFWKPSASAVGVTTGGADHAVSIRLPSTLRVKQPGKADWTHYEWYVPTTENQYIYISLAVSWRKKLWKRMTFWARYWSYILWFHHYGFNNDDLRVVAVTPESAPMRAFRPDLSIIEWRRHVEDNARTRQMAPVPGKPSGVIPIMPVQPSAQN